MYDPGHGAAPQPTQQPLPHVVHEPSVAPSPPPSQRGGDYASGRRKLTFPESIENERSNQPLVNPDSFSSKLRRRLLRGEALSADDGVAMGGTNGVLGAACKLMAEWGFEFINGTNTSGKRTYKLKNPHHVPRVHTPRVPGPSRTRRTDGEEEPKKAKKGGPSPLHDAIRERLVSGEEISCVETLQMGASEAFLRKEVKRLEAEGYKFGISGHGPERTYILMKAPKGRKTPPARTQTSTALARPVGHHIEMANGGGGNGHVPTSAVDMLFSELMMPTPRLGGAVRIMGAALNEEDESLTVLFKNGSGAWTARLEGYVEADVEAE